MTTFAGEQDKIAFFFQSPNTKPRDHSRDGLHSVLYLLRRELIETLGYHPDQHTETDVERGGSRHRLFASMILMFTTIDLLAKFVPEPPGKITIGQRFINFLSSHEHGQVAPENAKLLWAARNSLVHAFGVPDDESLAKVGLKYAGFAQRKEEHLPIGSGQTFIERSADAAVVYVDGLYKLTMTIIPKLEESLYGEAGVPNRPAFVTAFDKYGRIRIG